MSEVLVTDAEVAASHAEFAATTFGRKLARQVRYGRYKPTGVNNGVWERLLGADVNNLRHMPLTRGLMGDFIRVNNRHVPDSITPDDAARLKVAAEAHDRAEAVKGDKSYSLKTRADEVAEQAAFRRHFDVLGVGSPAVRSLIAHAVDEIIFDKNGATPNGRRLSAVEHVGYMRTALRAADHVAEGQLPYYLDRGMRGIVADVMGNATPVLLKHAEEFPAVDSYLDAQRDRMSAAFEAVSGYPQNFMVFGEYAGETNTRFLRAWVAWTGRLADRYEDAY